MPSPSLLQRLKERKLVQWALAYLAGAWVLFEVADVVGGHLEWPEPLYDGLLVLLGIGFFVALILAWYHGEKGRQKVSGPELIMVAALLVVAGGVLSVLRPEPTTESVTGALASPDRDDTPFVAVLPLANLSGREEDAWFTDGMHGQILTQLSKIASLGVISSTSVQEYRESPKNLRTVGNDLGARYIAEGDVLRAGGDVRINIQLIDAAEDRHVWAETYDRSLSVDNLFSIQSDIAQQVARAIGAFLTQEEETRIEAVPTEDLEAYEAYMLGRHHLARRDDPSEAFAEAERYLQTAVERDSNLAVAHAALALAYANMAIWSLGDPREIWPLVEQWSRSALAIDSTVGTGHLMLARVQWIRDRNWEGAERGIQRALELSPSDSEGHRVYMEFLLAQGRIEEGLREMRIAAALDPLSSPTLQGQARSAFFSRRYNEADELIEILLTRDPENSTAEWFLAHSFLFGGHPEQVARLYPGAAADSVRWSPLRGGGGALLLSLLGETDRAKQAIEEVVSSFGDQYFGRASLWRTYATLGEEDEAFYWMERDTENQSYHTAFFGVTPFADPLRDDTRYQEILNRIGLGHLKERFDSLAAADPRRGM